MSAKVKNTSETKFLSEEEQLSFSQVLTAMISRLERRQESEANKGTISEASQFRLQTALNSCYSCQGLIAQL